MFIKEAKVDLKNESEAKRFNKLFIDVNTPDHLEKIKETDDYKARKELIKKDGRTIISFS
jgi:hypothetical protein